MRLGVLASRDGWHIGDLVRAAAARGVEITRLDPRRLRAILESRAERLDADSHDVSELDALLVRAMPHGSLEQIVFRLDVLRRAEARGLPVVNPPRAIETAVDKYLALSRMLAAQLPVPPTRVSECAAQALDDFDALGGDVVLKPLFGSEGRGMLRPGDREIHARAASTLERTGAVIYTQAFVDGPGHDYRLLLVDDRLVAAMRRHRPRASLGAPSTSWQTNVARGGRAEPFEPSEAVVELARRAQRAVGTRVAGIDILPDRHGGLHVLEVNSSPGWRHLSAVTGVDVAAHLIDFLVDVSRQAPRLAREA